jgi:hypothetical protein
MLANKNIRRELLKTQATENVIVIVVAPQSCLSPGFFALLSPKVFLRANLLGV